MNITVTLHQAEGLPETPVTIKAYGSVGKGLDHSLYTVDGLDMFTNPLVSSATTGDLDHINILFQSGPIPEVGHNGVTIEHLLAICGHRLEELQSGPFASDYNGKALEHIKAAIASLNQRTLDRIARQVKDSYQT